MSNSPDPITVPIPSATPPDAPLAIGVAGAAAIPPHVSITYPQDIDQPAVIELENAKSLRLMFGDADLLTAITLRNPESDLQIRSIRLPSDLDTLEVITGSGGDYVGVLARALPDRDGQAAGTVTTIDSRFDAYSDLLTAKNWNISVE